MVTTYERVWKRLKPCPFCGAEAGYFDDPKSDAPHLRYHVYCCGVGCYAEGPYKSTRAAAVRAWNSAPRKGESK